MTQAACGGAAIGFIIAGVVRMQEAAMPQRWDHTGAGGARVSGAAQMRWVFVGKPTTEEHRDLVARRASSARVHLARGSDCCAHAQGEEKSRCFDAR
jgi:hypothetical protein